MGNGKAPAGIDLDAAESIDDGTLARTDSPAPGPIGLDANSGSATPSSASIADQIVGYARSQRGRRVGNGSASRWSTAPCAEPRPRAQRTTARSRPTRTINGARR